MTVYCESKGKYLGMHLDFTEDRMFQVDMSRYIQEILNNFPERIQKSSTTPHSDTLFMVKDEESAVKLSEDQAMQFHRTTAQLLFLSTQAQNDIQTAVSFLTTCVNQPDTDD